MPTYEYACDACGHQFEEFQSIKAKPITKCPKCKKSKVKRLISAGAGFIFKGSGFYITDYRDEKYKAAAKSDTGGGESKPDAKAESGKTDAGKKEAAPAKAEAAPAKTESKPAKSESKPAAKTRK